MKKVLLAVTLLGVLASSVYAQETDFAAVDADGDGMVTMEEATAAGWSWSDEDFSTADADGDGGLNEEEFVAATGN